MSMLDRIRDSFKYLDKNGLKHLIEKIKLHDVHWTGTHAEYEAVKDTLPAYTILHFTDDYDENVEVGVYATKETKTGEIWIDNKPIYRRVVQLSSTVDVPTNWGTVPSMPSDIDTLVSFSVLRKDSDSTGIKALIDVSRSGTGAFQWMTVSNNMGVNVLVIKYTKTTD